MSFSLGKLSRKQTRSDVRSQRSQTLVEDSDPFEDFSFSTKRKIAPNSKPGSKDDKVSADVSGAKETGTPRRISLQSSKSDSKLLQQTRVVLEKLENSPLINKLEHCFRCHQSLFIDLAEHAKKCPARKNDSKILQVRRMLRSDMDATMAESDTSPEIVTCVKLASFKDGAVEINVCGNVRATEEQMDDFEMRATSLLVSSPPISVLDGVSEAALSTSLNVVQGALSHDRDEVPAVSRTISSPGTDGFRTTLNGDIKCLKQASATSSNSKSANDTTSSYFDKIDAQVTQDQKDTHDINPAIMLPPTKISVIPNSIQGSLSDSSALTSSAGAAHLAPDPYDRLPCPICCKTGLKGLVRQKHIRSCAAKQGMNVGELNAAVALQMKQAEERLAVGLPIATRPTENRSQATSRRVPRLQLGVDPDLDVALAMSASIHEAKIKEDKIMEENILIEAGMEGLIEAISEEPPKPGPSKVKSGSKLVTVSGGVKNRLLLTLTKDQREIRASERVAEILGSSTEVQPPPPRRRSSSRNANFGKLAQINENPRNLWHLSTAEQIPLEMAPGYYVEEIRDFFSPKKKKKKDINVLDIPGRQMTQKAIAESSFTEQPTQEILIDLQRSGMDVTWSPRRSPPKNSSTRPNSVPPDQAATSPRKMKQISGPLDRLSVDFSRLLGKKEFSTSVVVLKGGSEIYVHDVVLFCRCPELAKALINKGKYDLKFLSKTGGLVLLNYIYSAVVPKELTLTNGDKSQLYLLANQYDLVELKKVLRSLNFQDSVELPCGSPDLVPAPCNVGGIGNVSNTMTGLNGALIFESRFDADSAHNGEMTDKDVENLSDKKETTNKHRLEGRSFSESVIRGRDSPEIMEVETIACLSVRNTLEVSTKRRLVRSPTPDLFDDVIYTKRSKSDVGRSLRLSPNVPQAKSQSFSSFSRKTMFPEPQRSGNQCSAEDPAFSRARLSFEAQRISEDLSRVGSPGEKSLTSPTTSQKSHSCSAQEVINLATPEELRTIDDVDGTKTALCSSKKTTPAFTISDGKKLPLDKDLHFDDGKETVRNPEIEVYPPSALPLGNNSDFDRSKDIEIIAENLGDAARVPSPCVDELPPVNTSYLDAYDLSDWNSAYHLTESPGRLGYPQTPIRVVATPAKGGCLPSPGLCQPVTTPNYNPNASPGKDRSTPDAFSPVPLIVPDTPVGVRGSPLKAKSSHNDKSPNSSRVGRSDSPDCNLPEPEISSKIAKKGREVQPLDIDYVHSRRRRKQVSRLRRRSKSLDILPDDSFDDIVANLEPEELRASQTPVRRLPERMKKIKSYPAVTPKPQYEQMVTPELRKELDRFGLKPLKRKNAVKILNHIYEETHPFVTDSEDEVQVSPIRKPVTQPKKPRTKAQESPQSESSSDENEESNEEIALLEKTEEEEEGLPTSSQAVRNRDLPKLLDQFIRERKDIYKKILLYEPIWLNELHQQVKEAGIKCGAAKLIEWLDDQGITFRIPTTRNESRRRKGPKTKKVQLSQA